MSLPYLAGFGVLDPELCVKAQLRSSEPLAPVISHQTNTLYIYLFCLQSFSTLQFNLILQGESFFLWEIRNEWKLFFSFSENAWSQAASFVLFIYFLNCLCFGISNITEIR